MITIAVILFGIKIVNWHINLPFPLPSGLPPIEYKPTFGLVTLDIVVAAKAPAPGSKEITAVAPGTIVQSPANPDVSPATPVSPMPTDQDWSEPTSEGDPSGSPVDLVARDVDAKPMTALEKALKSNKA